MTSTDLYTVAQAAAKLQVSESWLRKRATARAVPTTFLGRMLRFSECDLEEIIAAHREEPRTAGRRRGRRGHTKTPRPQSHNPAGASHPPTERSA